MSTITQVRGWRGPAILSFGFRPFFLAGALHAALMVGLWVPVYLGAFVLPSALPPAAWHAHEMLFGYVPAVVAGFLLTAVPNWTGRLPVVGHPLAALFALWLLGRIAIALSSLLDPVLVAILTLAFPIALGGLIGREIVAGGNWRNLKVLGAVAILSIAQGLFHLEMWHSGVVTYAARLALAVTMMLIMLIGGRIVPSFTLNWLRQNRPGPLPAQMGRYDIAAMIACGAALIVWVVLPAFADGSRAAGPLLLVAGVVQIVRQLRWRPFRTLQEPLVAVLHAGYGFVSLGFLVGGLAIVRQDDALQSAAIHIWTIGGIGLMTLAVMTRATLGHTGRALHAGSATVAIYCLVAIAVASRVAAALMPEWTMQAMPLAAAAWVAAFLGFAAIYGPMLVQRRLR